MWSREIPHPPSKGSEPATTMRCGVSHQYEDASLPTADVLKSARNVDYQTDQRSEENASNNQQFGWSFCCILRAIQLGFIFLLVYASLVIVKSFISVPLIGPTSFPVSIIDGTPNISVVRRDTLQDPPSTTLLDIHNFTLLLEPDKNLCSTPDLLFFFIVHSKPNNFRRRRVIRQTWGGLRQFQAPNEVRRWSTRLVFVLGETSDQDEFQPRGIRPSVGDLVADEHERWGDIVLGSFNDEYRKLKYKHVLGLRFATEHCSNALLFIKADDDAFIDIPGLYLYLVRTFGTLQYPMKDILAGSLFPTGTPALREGKWAVKVSEYPWRSYPSYLGGLAYLVSPDIARDLYRLAHFNNIPTVWVDDVWVTGLLARGLGVEHLSFSLRYSFDHDEMTEWLSLTAADGSRPHFPPYTFAHLDPTRKDWESFTLTLWQRVLSYYNVTANTSRTHSLVVLR